MKLEGSLDAFSLPDIFQLLSFTTKTGGLHLASDGSDGVVFFASGQVTGASADSSRQPLARRLVGSGAVHDDALRSAVEAVANGEGVGVVRALMESGAVDAGLLRQAATDQAVDAIFDLLRWRTGDFAFVIDEANPDDVGVTLAVEQVLADAEARRSSWDTVSQVIPSLQSLLAMPVVLSADPSVTREEWSLLALVDGRRSVAELVDLTGSGQYAVVSTLAALVQRGLLEVRAEDGEGGEDTDHVAVVLRRQGLLASLERFTPVVAPAAAAEDGAEIGAGAEVGDEPSGAETSGAEPFGEIGGGNDHQEAGSASDVEESGIEAPVDGSGSDWSGPDGAGPDEPVADDPELVTASASAAGEESMMLGGAHVPQDVVPPRPEPFLPKRQADFDETAGSPAVRPVHVQAGPSATVGEVIGATATAPDANAPSVIERDPNVNRSLMLRLIAGVRGL